MRQDRSSRRLDQDAGTRKTWEVGKPVGDEPLITLREGDVVAVLRRGDGYTEALVTVDGGVERALSYHAITGPLHIGDRVSLNTTAVKLGLGTGGVHFIMSVHGRSTDACEAGHIMKARYTPAQVKVLSVEEPGSPHNQSMQEIPDFARNPVVVGSLHSQVPIAAATIKGINPSLRVVYVMTDGGALPAHFSRVLTALRKEGVVDTAITTGHAFGGDVEAVTPAAGMAAARVVACADIVLVAMGPGVVGTGTPLGTTALEQGPLLDTASALGATAIAMLRVSFADERPRHLGVSHHAMTALTKFTHLPAVLPLPITNDSNRRRRLDQQADLLRRAGHHVVWKDGERPYARAKEVLESAGVEVTTMGRTDREDPVFFHATAAAAQAAVDRIRSAGCETEPASDEREVARTRQRSPFDD